MIPQASPDALLIINQLLSVNPHSRPTATQALAFEYLKGAETMCDYDKQYLTRPPADLFDFENEKYTLEELRELIVGEVRLSAYQNQGLREKLRSESKREDKEISQNRRISDSKSSSAFEEHLTSSIASSRRISHNDESKGKSTRDSDSDSRRGGRDDMKSTPAAVDDITAEEAELARIQQMDTNPTHRNSLSRSLSNTSNINASQREAMKATKSSIPSNPQGSIAYRQSSTTSKTNLPSTTESRMKSSRGSVSSTEESKDYLRHHEPSTSSTYGHVLSATNRGPKTPPAVKMDIIIQKGLRAKRVALKEDATTAPSHSEEKEQMTDADRSNISAVKGAAQSSSFLKGRHFGFLRSTSGTANRSSQQPQHSATSGQAESQQKSDLAHPAGISSLLSQFSGRYQGLGRSKTTGTTNSSSNSNAAAEQTSTNPSGGPLTKFAASKLVRASSAKDAQARGPR